jgi:hypothetical protein
MTLDREQLRQDIDQHLTDGRWPEALAALERLWHGHPSAALAGYISGSCERLRPHLPFQPCRLAVLRSFTVEPVLPLLRAGAWVNRIDLTVKTGGFNAYAQELLDPGSWLYTSEHDAVFLAVQTEDVAPALWYGFGGYTAAEIRATVGRVVDDFENWIRIFRSRSQAYLVIHNLETPSRPNRGILDGQTGGGQIGAICEINTRLAQLAEEFSGVYVLD